MARKMPGKGGKLVKNSAYLEVGPAKDSMGEIIQRLPGETMKTTLLALALTLSFTSAAFAADGIFYTVKTTETLTLKKTSKTKFEKISQVATGIATLDRVSGGVKNNLSSQNIDEGDDQSVVTLEVTGKNLVRLVDEKESINQEVKANVSSSLFGSVKKIQIDASTVDALYSASMKRSGLSVLKGLRFLTFGATLSSSIINSDMNCLADGDTLTCKQDSTLLISVE